jgi:glycosyltransferase involved in cell wall biosynthesis
MDLYDRITSRKVKYDLSILVLSLPGRLEKATKLIKELSRQAVKGSVQIVYLGDNKSLSVGEKRNLALTVSSGTYVAFIDDDDWVTPDYIESLLEAIKTAPEVITFRVMKYRNGVEDKEQRFYLNVGVPYLSPDKSHYKMCPNHLCAWRRDLIKERYPDKNLAEDLNWSEAQRRHYKTIYEIDKVLYFYYYDTELSETHRRP